MGNKLVNLKNFGSGLILMLLVISIVPVAIAEDVIDTPTVDSATQEEIKTMGIKAGSGLRLLQLERAISRQILQANEVIKVLEASGLYPGDERIAQQKQIAADLQSLVAEVQKIDPSAKDAVQQFIAIKDDAILLSQEFKELSKELIKTENGKANPELLAAIKEGLKTADRTELKDLNKRILDIRREHRAEVASKYLESIGTSDPALIEKIRSGAIAVAEVRQQLRQRILSVPSEARSTAIQKIKESNVKRAVFSADQVKQIRSNRLERRSNVAERRSNRLERRGKDVRAWTAEKRSDRRERRSDRLD